MRAFDLRLPERTAQSGGKLSRLLQSATFGALDVQPSILVVHAVDVLCEPLCHYLQQIGSFHVESATSLEQACARLARDPERFFCVVWSLDLPNSDPEEVVNLVVAPGIASIILTATLDKQLRQTLLVSPIVDYMVVRHVQDTEHVAYVVGRLYENRNTKVIVAEGSPVFRTFVDALLKRYCYQTYLATSARELFALMNQHSDTSLIVTDIALPDMDGVDLVTALRTQHRREDLAIIAMSDCTDHSHVVKLLKHGANDFISKPFEVEEFYCRVTQSSNMIGYVRQIRYMATRDFLTGVFNRRHLYEIGNTLWANARRKNLHIAVGLVDADHFKAINDVHGHHVGDRVLKSVAQSLMRTVRQTDVVARYGGEEFVCIAVVKAPEDAAIVFERIRADVENLKIMADHQQVSVSISAGYTTELGESLEQMLKRADEAVYRAKRAGRNRVIQG